VAVTVHASLGGRLPPCCAGGVPLACAADPWSRGRLRPRRGLRPDAPAVSRPCCQPCWIDLCGRRIIRPLVRSRSVLLLRRPERARRPGPVVAGDPGLVRTWDLKTWLVRTKCAAAIGAVHTESPLATGYCGGLSAEFDRDRPGDFGRCGSVHSIAHGRPHRSRHTHAHRSGDLACNRRWRC
jgi:hypothetical protein